MNLKCRIFLLFVLFFSVNTIKSQGVSIGETLTEPHNTAILDLQSGERGFLLPRMTTAERNAIENPAVGLQIYNLSSNCINYFTGITWAELCGFICGKSDVLFMYGGVIVMYGTVIGVNDRCWLNRNLGALQVAKSSTDHLAYGDLYQWGRESDGHQLINWTSWNMGASLNGVSNILSNTDQPLHENFILAPNYPHDWRDPQNPILWQGTEGTNNPCPRGWRLPTSDEWNIERLSWNINNSEGAFNSTLKLPMPGRRRHYDGGIISDIGSQGAYWSSSVGTVGSGNIAFTNIGANVGSNGRGWGFSVRCIKD